MSFNHVGKYVCVCGKEFNSSQSFNGHKVHCKEHQIQKYGSLKRLEEHNKKCIDALQKSNALKAKEKREAKEKEKQSLLELWLSEQHKCERCGKTMTEYYGSGRFCSKFCAHSRCHTEKTKENISKGVKNSTRKSKSSNHKLQDEYYKNPNRCTTCNSILEYKKRFNKTCCDECYRKRQRRVHLEIQPVQRSKNEIGFFKKCSEYFKDTEVVNNEKIFNGWDADIIIPKYKIAILWNGIWHYKKITPNQKFTQIQNRDKIKLDEIIKCGYVPYIIEDLGSYSEDKIELEFSKFIEWFNSNY